MSEWNENRLDQELEAIMKDIPESDDLEARINKCINRRIKRTVICTVATILVIALAAVFVINPVMNAMFFNPYEMNEGEEQKMLGVMRDYVETVFPYREAVSLEVEERGFGRYEIAMQVLDLSQPPINIGVANVWVEMKRGKYGSVKDSDSVMIINVGRFGCDWNDQEEMINQIQELPKSADIFLSVSDTQPKTLEQLRNLPVVLFWLQVYQPNVDFQGGLQDSPTALYSEDDNRDDMTEQEMLEVYCRNLKNVLENPEVWEGFGGLTDHNGRIFTDDKQVLKETYEDAKKLTSLTSENYCVYGSRDQIIEFLQENELDSIYVDNVKLEGKVSSGQNNRDV